MSKEEIEASHKKALKNLDGEKRAAVKKAKGMKGKKGKEAVAAVEDEFATKIKALEDSYQESLAALAVGSLDISADSPTGANEAPESNNIGDYVVDDEAAARERKQAKAKKKRERQKEKEAEKERLIEEENTNAGPGPRKIELEQIQAVLTPLKLKISEVEADGHCLYRAVAAQSGTDYKTIREFLLHGNFPFASHADSETFRSLSQPLRFPPFQIQDHYAQKLCQNIKMNSHHSANTEMKFHLLMNIWRRSETVQSGEDIWN